MPARFDEQYGVFVFSVQMEKKGTRLKLLILIGVNYTICPWARKLTHDFQSMFLSLFTDTNISSLMYQSIFRPQHKDWGVILGDEVSLQAKDGQFRLDSEFIRVKLTTVKGTKHVEYHAQVVPKPLPVNHRKENGLPLSVVIIGLDSLSAAHFQRALPEASKFMKEEMNSVFLKGYSVVGDGTTPALAALMTGKQRSEGRAGTEQDTNFC